MSLGLLDAGFHLCFAFDINTKAIDTYRRNLGGKAVVSDVRELTGAEILEECRLEVGDLDLLAGGPPCQGFSKQTKGAVNGDERNNLVLEFIRLVQELRPATFLFENVAIFGQKRGRTYVRCMERELLGDYILTSGFLNAADYGLAQTRERFIVVGVRGNFGRTFSLPGPTVRKWKTVGDVLAGLPEPPDDYSDHPGFPNHQRARVTPINIERFSHVPQGGGWRDIPQHLRIEAHKNVDTSKGGWPDVYGRLEWSGQCPTITGGFDSFTRGRFGHPLQDRPLTPREAARLQGFPDEFLFCGNRADIRSQIGNAVPPPLAREVGQEIVRYLSDSRSQHQEPTEPHKAAQMAFPLLTGTSHPLAR